MATPKQSLAQRFGRTQQLALLIAERNLEAAVRGIVRMELLGRRRLLHNRLDLYGFAMVEGAARIRTAVFTHLPADRRRGALRLYAELAEARRPA